jgi:hypothetical protein
MQSGIGLQECMNMPKYIVSFQELSSYNVPVEAASPEEAREKARIEVIENPDAYRDGYDLYLAEEDVIGMPNTEVIDDASFEQWGSGAA